MARYGGLAVYDEREELRGTVLLLLLLDDQLISISFTLFLMIGWVAHFK